MDRFALIALNFIAYLFFIYTCFTLMEGMLFGRHYGTAFRVVIGIFNAGLMVLMALSVPINIAYLCTLLALFLELLIIFRCPLKDTLIVAVAVMMNIMCLRGIVLSLFALARSETLHAVYSNPKVYLVALICANLLELGLVLVILRFVQMANLRYTMRHKMQSTFILIWASLCVLFMFRSAEVYVRDYNIPNMFIDHLSYCFILILSFYYLMFYTFRINQSAKLEEINKNLHKELGNQMVLQSALTREALFTTKANLTKNRIISGTEVYSEPLADDVKNDYDVWFEFAKAKIFPDDLELYLKSLDRQKLLDNFYKGVEPKPFEYRRFGTDRKYHWVRLVLRMFSDVETADVYLFGYAFDIEEEVRSRQALILSAQTDLYTGLFNKGTTEKLIDLEIKKGTGVLLLFDVDDFKNVNDEFGHEAGDFVLKHVSLLLSDIFRRGDIIGRIGGDEFMVFMKGTTDPADAAEKAREFAAKVKLGVDYNKFRIIISASIGISIADESVEGFSQAYNQADAALYQAKSLGDGSFVIFGANENVSTG